MSLNTLFVTHISNLLYHTGGFTKKKIHILLIHKTQKGWFYNTIYTEMNNSVLCTLFCFYSSRGLFKQTPYIRLCGNTQTFCAFHVARITFRFLTVHHFFVKAVTTTTISLHTEKKKFNSRHSICRAGK